MRGLSIPAGIMVAPGVNGNTPDIDVPAKVDPERAKKLLADAGYPNGFEFQLNCPNNRYVNDEEICQNLVGMWARIGVKTKLVAESMATFIQKVQNFDTSAYLLGWGVATFDAQYTLQSLIRTRTTGADGNFNFGRVSDAEAGRAGRRDEDRDRRGQAQRADPRRTGADPRRGALHPAAPPAAALGHEEGRDHVAPRRRPAGSALHVGEPGRVLTRRALPASGPQHAAFAAPRRAAAHRGPGPHERSGRRPGLRRRQLSR